MSKRRRKKSNKPNIPQATLERAREQAGLPPEDEPESDTAADEVTASAAPPKPAASPKRRNRRISDAQLEKAKQKGDMDQAMVADLLMNPTKDVTEEELHQDYAYVLQDLRNMGVLAAALLVLLVVLAQLL